VILRILYQSTLGIKTIAETGPRWFVALNQALGPRKIPLRGGEIGYSGTAQDLSQVLTLWKVDLASTATLIPTVFLTSSHDPAVLINSTFNKMEESITAPTDRQMLEIFTDYCSFMSNQKVQFNEAYADTWGLVSFMDKQITIRDSSAFQSPCVVGEGKGEDAFSTGGVIYTSYSVTPPRFPILGSIRSGQVHTGPSTLYTDVLPRHSCILSGGPYSMTGFMQQMPNMQLLKVKNHFNFKFVNFDEIFDCFYQLLQQVLNNFINSNALPPTPVLGNYKCPLTKNQAELMIAGYIRYALSEAFAWNCTVHPTRQGLNGWRTFQAGTNCAPSTVYSGVKLPILFAEAIYAMNIRFNYLGSYNPRTKGTNFNDPQVNVPVVGRYSTWVQPTYVYTKKSDATTYPIFTTSAIDLLIDPVDGSVLPSRADYVDLNSGNVMAGLITQFNNWITQFTAVVEGLGIQDAGYGLDAIETISMTNIVKYDATLSGYDLDYTSNINILDQIRSIDALKKKAKIKNLDAAGPSSICVQAVTCSHPINQTAWDLIQNLAFKPHILVDDEDNSDEQRHWDIDNIQIACSEMFSIVDNSASPSYDRSMTLAARNAAFVTLMVTTPFSDAPSPVTQYLVAAGKEGRGGGWGTMLIDFLKGLGIELFKSGAKYTAGKLNDVAKSL